MKKLEEINNLYEIALALNSGVDLKKCLNQVLDTLSRAMEAKRGAITILNPLTNEIRMEVAHGISKTAMRKGTYKPGEGITGEVIQTGRAIVVPQISREPRFLDKTASRKAMEEELSFVCVPVKKGSKVTGTLSLDFAYDAKRDLSQANQTLTVVAAMIAQKVINLEAFQREQLELKEENLRLQQQLNQKHRITGIVGNSNKMREVFQMISQVCQASATVLVRGESGTGKELVASAIHYSSPRSKEPFIKINCAALPPTLIESELRGHEKGSFTGAMQRKLGKFEIADKGTIFLDEIGSLGLESQASLLRVLQEKQFERVGGNRTISTDVRVVAATNRNLEKAVEEGKFRGDLYYRLNVFPIYLPPLRERKTDILLLAEYFLEKLAAENKKQIKRFSTPAIDMLTQYHWPGNVRELENCIERAVLLCDGGVIRSSHLPPTLQTGEHSGTVPQGSLEEAVAALEKEMIVDALKNTRGNMARASELLGVTVRKFTYKAKKYGIDHKSFRKDEAGVF